MIVKPSRRDRSNTRSAPVGTFVCYTHAAGQQAEYFAPVTYREAFEFSLGRI